MMKTRRHDVVFFIFLSLDTHEDMYNVIKIAYGAPTHISALPVRYGVARGIFAQAGLDLSVRTIFGGPELALALDRGALWIGEIGSPSGITAIAHGAGLRIVASAEKRPALMYLGLHQSIEAWSELRGERIGVLTTGSCGYWFLREILTRNGLDPDRDVEIVQLGKRYPDVLQLIEDRMIEGALLVEPFLSTCVKARKNASCIKRV